jgi:hypothetical protein
MVNEVNNNSTAKENKKMRTSRLGTRYDTVKDARAAALKASQKNPKIYVTVFACFGLYLSCKNRLNVFDPTDNYIKSYWLNGKEKPFSEKQIIADQQAQPMMS